MTLGGRCGLAKHDAYTLETDVTAADVVRLRLSWDVGEVHRDASPPDAVEVVSGVGDVSNFVPGVRKGRVSQYDQPSSTSGMDVRETLCAVLRLLIDTYELDSCCAVATSESQGF